MRSSMPRLCRACLLRVVGKDRQTRKKEVRIYGTVMRRPIQYLSQDRHALSKGIPEIDLNWSVSGKPESWWSWRPWEVGWNRFLLVGPPTIVSVMMMPLCFLLLPTTLRRARVSRPQLARFWAFSFAALLPLVLMEFMLPSGVLSGAAIESLRKLWYTSIPLGGIIIPAILLWAWWWGACRLLRLPRAPLVAGTLVLIANLSTGLFLGPWIEDWFWILGTWSASG